ncbi:MAG: MBL fold metallo-hydrolase [Nannocystaceae bacterium]|nr:MBL fold metallo-hydrolase [Nannocystaceae bacterium]
MREPYMLDPGYWVAPLRTPTLPPASATNTAIVGKRKLAVLEPATPHPDEQGRLLAMLDERVADGAQVEAILITHHHSDHIGFAQALAERTGAPILAHRETARRVSMTVDRHITSDTLVELDAGHALRPVFTPGHAPGHLVFLDTATGIVHAGDMVAGEGSILIDPDDGGDMSAYLASLERLAALGASRLVPAHGGVFDEPEAVCRHFVEHRLGREGKVLAAIGTESKALPEILASAYADTPKMLWPLAEKSLRAHLSKLVTDGRVLQDETGARRVET